MHITFNSHTAQDALDILRYRAAYIDENLMILSDNQIKKSLNEIEDAVRALKFFMSIK